MANISASTGPVYIYLDNDINLTMSGASGNSIYEYNVNKAVKRGSSLVTNANVYKGAVYKDEDADGALVEKIGDRFLGNLEVPFPAIWEDGDGFKPHAGQYGIFTVDSPSAGRQKIFYAYAIKGKDVSGVMGKYNRLSEPINGHACPEQKLPFTVVWDRNNTCDTSMLYPLEGAWVTLEGSATTHTIQMNDWSNAVVWGYNIRQKPDSFYYSWTGTGTTLNITIPENNSKYERKFAVNVSQSPLSPFICPSNTFYFFQKSNLFFNLITTATTVDEDGGVVDFNYETNISTFNPKDLLVKVNGFDTRFVNVTSGSTQVDFYPNPDNENKQGTVEFYLYMDGEEPDRLLATAYVTQLGQDENEYFNTDTSERYLSPSGGTETIYFDTNISVEDLRAGVQYFSDADGQIIVHTGYTLYSNRLVIDYPANDSENHNYYWDVTIWRYHPSPMQSEKLATIEMIQRPDSQPQPIYYFNLITTGATVPASGGTARIYYNTNIPLSKIDVTVKYVDGTIEKTSSYTDVTIGEYYSPNESGRFFYVQFDTYGGEHIRYLVEITQPSLTSFIVLDKESVLPQIGGILDVRVSTDFANNDITVGNSDWLTYFERKRSGKTITYRFTFLTYTGQTGRDGYVTFTTPIGDFNASVTQIGRYFFVYDSVKQVPFYRTPRLGIGYDTNVPLEDITVSASSSAITILSYSTTNAYVSVEPWETTDGGIRTMYVTFKYEAIPGRGIMEEREVKIVQRGGEAYISVVNSAVTTSADEHDITVYYYSNIYPTEVSINKEGASEMIDSFNVSEVSDTMYDIVVHLNANTGETRTAALRLSSQYTDSVYAYITQLADNQYFNLVTTSLTLDWSGGTAVAEYDTNLPIDYVSAYTSYWADIVSQDATSVTIEYGEYKTSGYTREGYVDFRTPLGDYEVALVQPGPDVPDFAFLTPSERTLDWDTSSVTIEWQTTYSAVSYTYRARTLDTLDNYYQATTTASSITFSPPVNIWTEPQTYYFTFYLETEPWHTSLGQQKITIMGVPEAPVWSSATLYMRSSQMGVIPDADKYRSGAVRWEWKGLSRTVSVAHSGITTLNGLPWWEFTYQLSENDAQEPVSSYYFCVTNSEFGEQTALGDYYCNKELRGTNYVYTWERTPYHAEEVIIGEGITKLGSKISNTAYSSFNPATYVLGGTDTYFFPNPYVIPSTAQYIELPRTLRRIEAYVFYQCATNEIHYNGTMAQWKSSVYLVPDWCYPAGQWTVVCTDGNLEY